VVFGDALVATAEGAKALTKWKVDIEAYPFAGVAFRETSNNIFFPFALGKIVAVPVRNCWVTGISRAWDIVF